MQPCPSCHQIDQVQKVSALVGASTSYGSEYLRTDIAGKLSLPKMPERPYPEKARGCSSWLLLLAVGLFCPATLFVIGVASSDPTARNNPMGFLGVALLWFIPGIVALVIRQVFVERERREHAKLLEQLAAEHQQKLTVWRRLEHQWNRAYYCRRCDVVYLDGGKEYTSPNNMLDLLAKGS